MIVPEEIVQQLQALPVEEVARRLGLEVSRHKAPCFMHDDHHPSLGFNTQKNFYFCFVCHRGGGPIQLVQAHEGWPFVEACTWLGKEFAIWTPMEATDVPKAQKRLREKLSPFTSHLSPSKESVFLCDREVGEWIVAQTELSVDARRFLLEERHYRPDVVAAMHIRSLDTPRELTERLLQAFGEERCERSSFFYRWNDRLRLCYSAPCLLFPYYDLDGRLLSLQSRYLGATDDITPRFTFPRGVRQRLFNMPVLKTLKPDEPLYVCEGVTDCLALLSDGKKAVAFPSSSICHPEDVSLLAHRFLFMYPDSDAAGEALYTRLSAALVSYDTPLHRLALPDGCKDYSDYHRRQQK